MSDEKKHDLWDALPRPGGMPQAQPEQPGEQPPAPAPGQALELGTPHGGGAPGQGTMAPERTPGPDAKKPPIAIKAIPPPPPSKGIPLGKIVLLCFLAVGGYGGYYGYCRYEAGVKVKALANVAHGLRQSLLRVGRKVTREDIKAVVVGYAAKAGVEVDAATIETSIEPLTGANVSKLPKVAAMAMGIAMGIPKHQTPNWLVGFKARFKAKHGVCTQRFEHARYSYLEAHLSAGR